MTVQEIKKQIDCNNAKVAEWQKYYSYYKAKNTAISNTVKDVGKSNTKIRNATARYIVDVAPG